MEIYKAIETQILPFIISFCIGILDSLRRTSNIMSTKSKSEIHGTNAAAKDAGWKDFSSFLASYGLRLDRPEDVEEGKRILRAFGYGV